MQAALRAVEKKQLSHMLCVTNMLLHGIEDPSFVRHDNTLARPYISYTQSDRVDIVLTNPPFGGREEDGIESNFPKHFQTRETADLFLALIIRLLKPTGRAAVVLPDGSLFGEGVKTRLKEHLMEECNLHTIVRLPNSVFKPYASIGTNLLFFEKGDADQGNLVLRASRARGAESLLDDEADSLRASARLHRLVGRREAQGPRGNATGVESDGRGSKGARLQPRHQESAHGGRRPRRPGDAAGRLECRRGRDGRLTRPVEGDPGGGARPMNAERLLAHYERIADAPDAIARLRRFILDLAVRGKLVPQDPADEPASELLKRIAAEKAGERKKGCELLSVPDSNANFPAPTGWARKTLGTVANVVMGQSPPGDTYNKSGEGVPLLNGPVEFSPEPFGQQLANQYTTAPTNFCEKGDLLICVRGSTTGRTNVAGFRACIGRGVAAIRPTSMKRISAEKALYGKAS